MNAAIRASVRSLIAHGKQPVGVFGGYSGLLESQFAPLELGSVANIIQRGGTILRSGRCPEFLQPDQRQKAGQNLKKEGLHALVCIGGDGSFRGADLLYREQGIPVVAVPGTIDNDINGTDYTIGFDTAINTALEAIDRVRDTAASLDRLFIVEVMGRDTGYIATQVGLAGGAEEVFAPEKQISLDQVIQHIQRGLKRGKRSSILVTAEGRKPGRAYDLAEAIRKKAGFEAKVCILGHIQRGGPPTAMDRVQASRFGAASTDLLLQGQYGKMVALKGQEVVAQPINLVTQTKAFDLQESLRLVQLLSL